MKATSSWPGSEGAGLVDAESGRPSLSPGGSVLPARTRRTSAREGPCRMKSARGNQRSIREIVTSRRLPSSNTKLIWKWFLGQCSSKFWSNIALLNAVILERFHQGNVPSYFVHVYECKQQIPTVYFAKRKGPDTLVCPTTLSVFRSWAEHCWTSRRMSFERFPNGKTKLGFQQKEVFWAV